MKAQLKKVPVSERALLARVNRRLAPDCTVIRRCRGDSRWVGDLGTFYSVNVSNNTIEARHIDLEKWARELSVLKAHEALAE